MRTNYILIDFENTQPGTIPAGNGSPIKVFVFVGQRQSKVPIPLAVSLQRLGGDAEYVQIEGEGQNALDFHIAYYLGKLAERDPDSYFHIVSKDKGFDPLIRYLKKNKIRIQRVSQLSEILVFSNGHGGSAREKAAAVGKSLKARGTSVPRRIKTLQNTIHSFFMKSLSEAEIKEIIAHLQAAGVVTITGQVVEYTFPPEVPEPVNGVGHS